MVKLQEEVEESSTYQLAFAHYIMANSITLARSNQDLNLYNTWTDVNVKFSFFRDSTISDIFLPLITS